MEALHLTVRQASTTGVQSPRYSQLIAALMHPDPRRRDDALHVLACLGQPAVTAILAEVAVRRGQPRLCQRLLAAISAIGAELPLNEFMQLSLLTCDLHRGVRRAAARVLRRLPRVEQAVLTVWPTEAGPVIDQPRRAAG